MTKTKEKVNEAKKKARSELKGEGLGVNLGSWFKRDLRKFNFKHKDSFPRIPYGTPRTEFDYSRPQVCLY
jgi:hypothetical protein